MGLEQDAFSNHFAVVKGLCGKPHLSQAAGVDEFKHLKRANRSAPCGSSPPTS